MTVREKEHLIQQLDQARAKMRAVLADVDTQMEIYPGWNVKQVLAHIIGWEDVTITSLRAHLGGDEPAILAARSIDHYNAEFVATRETLSYDHVVKEWELV